MNAMEALHREVVALLPRGAKATLERPRAPDGNWFLGIRKASGYAMDVEWRPRSGFGLSAGRDLVFGSGVDEVFVSSADVLARIRQLIRRDLPSDPSGALSLRELRLLRGATQDELARRLEVTKGLVAQRESAAIGAMRVDTLREVVAALGGTLDLVVRLPEAEPRALKFGDG